MTAKTEPCSSPWKFCHFGNPRAAAREDKYPAELQRILNLEEFAMARQVVHALPDYARTPLHTLPALAERLGVEEIRFKDESARLGLSAFKGVGGIYAVFRLLQSRAASSESKPALSVTQVLRGDLAQVASGVTVACATTGNHGRSVARAAQIFGCRCVIFVPPNTTTGRVSALEKLGATVVRTEGNYDFAVNEAEARARANGWFIVSDTAYEGHESTPRDVMHGYRVIVDEVVEGFDSGPRPTHVFVQTGVGGIAAAFCSHLWQVWGVDRPRFVVVESSEADCMLRSARAQRLTAVSGALNTRMFGLAAGKPSALAWDILRLGADDFVTIEDEASFAAMRVLAAGSAGDPPIVAGEAGAAGLGALMAAVGTHKRREALGLSRQSRILLIGTEGATDPASYRLVVGGGDL